MPLQSSDIFGFYSARFSENSIERWTMETGEKEEASVTAGRIMPNLGKHPRPRDPRFGRVYCGRSLLRRTVALTLQLLAVQLIPLSIL